MADLTVDLSGLPATQRQALHAEFSRLNAEDMARARLRQYAIARFFREHPPRFQEGVGEMRMALDPYWEKHFKMAFGVEPTRDPGFQRWLRKHGEEQYFVRSQPARPVFGYRATRGDPDFRRSIERRPIADAGGVRKINFRKTYL